MIINTKYFGLIADITNKKEEQLQLKETLTSVASLKSIMEANYPDLRKTSYSVAVNQALVGIETNLKEQDVIAFLPPFAGG
ncbi:MoaD/ThiS family protein [Flavobacterium sp. 7A]|uniref:MoaD/ThiS family protein n=1 Tax=Flavobacterium sp. 7A TaxID=2940571 RepID=UPI002225C144|nr:MoaD/ThiS family protein [Flavobacterium sp. 7A]MCW2119525.1 molybdopterin synthase sulfur carrier subunit [Flavobacterium sp. 7A]